MYRGSQNDVWSLGIFLTKILKIPHPYINFDIDTESTAKRKLIEGESDFRFSRNHLGHGRAASLIVQMLEPDPDKRITVSSTTSRFADSADPRNPRTLVSERPPRRPLPIPHPILRITIKAILQAGAISHSRRMFSSISQSGVCAMPDLQGYCGEAIWIGTVLGKEMGKDVE